MLAALGISMASCMVTRKPNGTIIVEPSNGSKPRKLPPQRVRQVTINGQCYFQFQAPSGVWYCFPCDQEGNGYAEPCESLVNPSKRGAHSFFAFVDELFMQEGVSSISGQILDHFGLTTWSEGDTAPVPMALALLDTDKAYVEVVVISRSDWEWPNDSLATVEAIAFPNSTGLLPDPTDAIPDAMAFRVSGSFTNVANAVASMFDSVHLDHHMADRNWRRHVHGGVGTD